MSERTTANEQRGVTHYKVVAPADATPTAVAAPAAIGKAAVFVVHGMGQQIQFQTLDDVAEGLRAANVRRGGGPTPRPGVRAVAVGDERPQRIELTLTDGDRRTREVHIYEAYWSPITEGEVTLRDVMRFLFNAGVDGWRHSFDPFRRYVAGSLHEFPTPVRTPVYLATALLVASALVVVNLAIVALALARAPTTTPPKWMSDALFGDVTAILNALVLAAIAFIGCLLLSYLARRWRVRRVPATAPRRLVMWISGPLAIFSFWLLIVITTASALAIAFVIYFHHTAQPDSAVVTTSLLARIISERWIVRLRSATDGVLWTLTAIGAVSLGGPWFLKVARNAREDLFGPDPGEKDTWRMTAAVLGAFATLLAILCVEAAVMFWASMRATMPAVSKWAHGLAWPLAIVIGAVVRRFLIQYVGDVAAYIQPQELDRFSALRARIKERVWNAAVAVYAAADQYNDVLFVGHSLGSVVAYDTLNRLLREEALGRTPFAVESRTRLLLTFGSPLDKTAFLFSLQGNTTEAREALAASVQPLLAFPERRPEWINIFSAWDIISGALNFYDLPGKPNPVTNLEDPHASVLLGAHTQYWSNELLFDRLHQSLL